MVAGYVAVVCLAAEVGAFPLAAYRGFVLERRYGLHAADVPPWLADHVKASALGLVLALVAGVAAYCGARRVPRVVVGRHRPRLLGRQRRARVRGPVGAVPAVLQVPAARSRRRSSSGSSRWPPVSAHPCSACTSGVWASAAAPRTPRSSAWARTRRILLSDTLLTATRTTRSRSSWRTNSRTTCTGTSGGRWPSTPLLTLGALACAHVVLLACRRSPASSGPSDVAGLPVLLLAAAAWSIADAAGRERLSRAHERRADRFALDLTRNPEAFVSAMKRLGSQNLADEQPSRLTEWWFHSHPTAAAAPGRRAGLAAATHVTRG